VTDRGLTAAFNGAGRSVDLAMGLGRVAVPEPPLVVHSTPFASLDLAVAAFHCARTFAEDRPGGGSSSQASRLAPPSVMQRTPAATHGTPPATLDAARRATGLAVRLGRVTVPEPPLIMHHAPITPLDWTVATIDSARSLAAYGPCRGGRSQVSRLPPPSVMQRTPAATHWGTITGLNRAEPSVGVGHVPIIRTLTDLNHASTSRERGVRQLLRCIGLAEVGEFAMGRPAAGVMATPCENSRYRERDTGRPVERGPGMAEVTEYVSTDPHD
jgi:hypothetical protein